jgi:hypothetical protein
MHIRHVRPAVFEVTLHAYELSALIAAARWAAEGAEGELAPDAREQLGQVVANYEESMQRAQQRVAADGQAQ